MLYGRNYPSTKALGTGKNSKARDSFSQKENLQENNMESEKQQEIFVQRNFEELEEAIRETIIIPLQLVPRDSERFATGDEVIVALKIILSAAATIAGTEITKLIAKDVFESIKKRLNKSPKEKKETDIYVENIAKSMKVQLTPLFDGSIAVTNNQLIAIKRNLEKELAYVLAKEGINKKKAGELSLVIVKRIMR